MNGFIRKLWIQVEEDFSCNKNANFVNKTSVFVYCSSLETVPISTTLLLLSCSSSVIRSKFRLMTFSFMLC